MVTSEGRFQRPIRPPPLAASARIRKIYEDLAGSLQDLDGFGRIWMDLERFAADLARFVGIWIDLSSLRVLQPPTRSAGPTKTDGFAIWSRGGLSIRLVWSVYLSLHGTQMRICPFWVENLLSPSRNKLQNPSINTPWCPFPAHIYDDIWSWLR